MNKEKKQKVLLGVLVVLLLGAGSIWYFVRDTGPIEQEGTGGSSERKRRVRSTTKEERSVRKTRESLAPEERQAERTKRERATRERKERTRRSGPRKAKKKKKEKTAPAA